MTTKGQDVQTDGYWFELIDNIVENHGFNQRDATSLVVLYFLKRGDLEPIAYHLRNNDLLKPGVYQALGVMMSGEQTPALFSDETHPIELRPYKTPMKKRRLRSRGFKGEAHPRTRARDQILAQLVDTQMDKWGTEKYRAYDAAIADTLKISPASTEAIIRNAHSRYGRHSRKPK